MSWLMLEYLCPRCGERIESLEARSAPSPSLPHCDARAERVLSAVKCKTSYASVTRGKSDGPPSPHAIDTRPLAEGMPRREWLEKRKNQRRDQRRAQVRSMVS